MRSWENHRDAAVVDLAAAGMPNATIEQTLGHLRDAMANINRAIDEAESEAEEGDERG